TPALRDLEGRAIDAALKAHGGNKRRAAYRLARMIDRDDIAVCVDIAQRSYRALQWLNEMLGRGILPVDGVHDDLTPQETARRWVRRFHPQFPKDAQPPESELDRFANYFATYLLTSFDLVEGATQERPGECGCWCRWCRRIVDTPNLQPAKPGRRDKDRAMHLMRNAVDELASECGASAADADRVFAEPELQEVIAMV